MCIRDRRHINGLHCLDFTFRKYMTVGVKRGFGSAVPQSVRNHTGGNIGVNEPVSYTHLTMLRTKSVGSARQQSVTQNSAAPQI